MDDYITVKRQFVLDAINIGLSGYISDDDKLTLEGMGIAVSEMPTTDLSGYSDRLWKSAYDRGYERCKDDAVEAIEILLEQSEDDEHDKTWNNAIRGAVNAVKHHVPSAQPEIIRCENCRRRDDKWEDWEEGKVLYWCDIMDGCVKADDYCSYAERRAKRVND